jgi:raffinose/stachyose/melibiose transport system permease protein
MTGKTKKTISLFCIVAGIVIAVFAIYLCIRAYPLRTRDIEGILSFRGFFLFGSLLLLAGGFYLYPTMKHRAVINVLFLLPVLIPFIMTVILPFFFGVFYSFTDWDGNQFTRFTGFANYRDFAKAPDYIYSFGMTVLFACINVTIVNILAFFMSLLVTQKIHGRNLYRAGFFIPNLIGGIVLGYVWQFIFNYIFVSFGKLIGVQNPQSMLINPMLALFALILVSTWQYAGYIMMIYVTALQGIPSSVLEASVIDGANGWKRMTHIIIPMIAHAFTICIFLTLVNSFKQFDLNYSLTNGGPSTVFMGKAIMSTELQALNIYKTAITRNEWALGQAKAVVFFIILAVVSLIQVSINKKHEEEL